MFAFVNFSGAQFHFYMENQVSICRPTEDGFEVYSSTQWLDLVQNGIANVLGVKNSSSINVHVKQLGGAYGKIIFSFVLRFLTHLILINKVVK